MLFHYLIFFDSVIKDRVFPYVSVVIYQDISWTVYEIRYIDVWFFFFKISWYINVMKEHNQNFSLGIQIIVSFTWSILRDILLEVYGVS